MKCPTCNAEISDSAKFCTKCGNKIERPIVCPSCGHLLKPGTKFCTSCGTKLVQNSEKKDETVTNNPVSQGATTGKNDPLLEQKGNVVVDDINKVGDHIYWNIQKGQVARVIDEVEFASYSDIKGVIVPDGTTAFLRANGQIVAYISGGTYNLSTEETPTGVRGFFQKILHLFSFKRNKDEQPSTEEELRYKEQQERISECVKNKEKFAVIIILNKAFPLLIGAKQNHLDDYLHFKPMLIQTANLKMNVGVNAYFKISDISKFLLHYLTDNKVLNSLEIVDDLADLVRSTLQDALYDVELDNSHFPKEIYASLKNRLNAMMADSFSGLSVVRIVEISAQNEDLNRFSDLTSEMYLSERELDYLKRSNDFKNRLADVNNQQRIQDAATELELKQQLNEINRNINKEELLNEDELLKFRSLIINERKLREARFDEERDAALDAIQRTRLIREEELEVLKHSQTLNQQQRSRILNMMQLKDGIEFERVRTEGQCEQALLVAKKDLERTALFDNYQDERFYKDLEKQKAVDNAQLDVEQRQNDMAYENARRKVELDEMQRQKSHEREMEADNLQFEQFMAMQQNAEQAKQNGRLHEERMEQARLENETEREKNRYEQAQHLSEDKLWALNGDSSAAAEFVKSKYNYEAERNANARVEAQRKYDEERFDRERAENRQDMRENQAHLYDMMHDVMHAMSGMQNRSAMEQEQRARDREDEMQRQMQEKDERIRRQEGRMDTAYDRALDYTTRNNVPPQPVQNQLHKPEVCPNCGAPLADETEFCAECGCHICKH